MSNKPEVDTNNETETAEDCRTINIGGDVLRPKLTDAVAEGRFTQESSDLVWWFYSICKERCFSLRNAAAELGVNTSTIHHLFHCTYKASIEHIVSKIRRYKKVIETRSTFNILPHISTSISDKVMTTCQAAWASQSIAMIWGESQIGKTSALEEYTRRNNHGTTKYIRLPAKAGAWLVMRKIAEACYVSPNLSYDKLYDRVLRAIDSSNILIIDELHEAFISYNKGAAIAIIEILREIHDITKCGMVLCMTNIGRDEILNGKNARLLQQMKRRGVIKVQLPDIAPIQDFQKIAGQAFKLPIPDAAAMEIIKTIRQHDGIGVFCHYLKMGARYASEQKEAMAWKHFTKMYQAIQHLSDGASK